MNVQPSTTISNQPSPPYTFQPSHLITVMADITFAILVVARV